MEELSDKLKAAMKMKETAKTTEAKLLSASAIEEAKLAIKQVLKHTYMLTSIII